MDLIQPVSRLSWPVLVDLLSDSEGFFQISCQSLTYPFPFFRKVKENKKKDPFYTKTRLTRYLRNLISQSCTSKSQKWLHEIIQFLKIFKILAVSLCQRWQKRIRFKAIWHEFSNPQFSDPRPPSGRPRERVEYFGGGGAPKKGQFFFNSPLKNSVEFKTVCCYKTLNFLSFFSIFCKPNLTSFATFQLFSYCLTGLT